MIVYDPTRRGSGSALGRSFQKEIADKWQDQPAIKNIERNQETTMGEWRCDHMWGDKDHYSKARTICEGEDIETGRVKVEVCDMCKRIILTVGGLKMELGSSGVLRI